MVSWTYLTYLGVLIVDAVKWWYQLCDVFELCHVIYVKRSFFTEQLTGFERMFLLSRSYWRRRYRTKRLYIFTRTSASCETNGSSDIISTGWTLSDLNSGYDRATRRAWEGVGRMNIFPDSMIVFDRECRR